MSTVTWANATRGKSAPWHMRQPGAAIWPSVDDQLGITPRHHQILPAASSRAENAFPQLIYSSQATCRRNLGLIRNLFAIMMTACRHQQELHRKQCHHQLV